MGNHDLTRGVDGIRLVSTIISSLIGICGRSEESLKYENIFINLNYHLPDDIGVSFESCSSSLSFPVDVD